MDQPAPSQAPPDIHAAPKGEVHARLGSRPQGLTQAEAQARLASAGRNTLAPPPARRLLVKFLANFIHLMALLLWAGGAVAFLAGMPSLGLAIWCVNLVNGLFSFWQEYKAERATEALLKVLPRHARVLRDGQERMILAEELVPGDVVLLTEGEHISADARVVAEAELRVDQSTLSGESHPVRKSAEAVTQAGLARLEMPNLVFAGTSVAAGSGRAVVAATGAHTAFGRIASLTQGLAEQPSPLQREIKVVTRVVSILAVGSGLAFFLAAATLARMGLAESFIFALGMIVALVPEGLLPTLTLSLAMGIQRMARRGALVKRLSAVETLGCTSVICTDKTGTLTQNEMTVREVWLAGRRLAADGVGYAPLGRILEKGRPLDAAVDPDLRALLLCAGLCNNTRLLQPSPEAPHWSVLGDPTEGALLTLAGKGGLDLEDEARRLPRLRELPFDSRRKRMTTVHQDEGGRLALVKGAPREVLALCQRLLADGAEPPLDQAWRGRILAANDEMARAGQRVLALARRSLPPEMDPASPEAVEQGLTFLGLAAMLDPPRPEVSQAVEKCRRAGIRVIMITGDYGLTAESIARRLGIIVGPPPRIVTGAELEAMPEPDLKQALASAVIFARAAPEHKLKVVKALQDLGAVVAVTGDGVNDAPALKQADIGVAMGRSGTDVARQAADMVLTDDNFATIVAAVEQGRAVYANIKKFTAYIFTCNATEAIPFILFALSGGRIPLALTVMQILSVDLGTDLVPALALGAEPPESGVMDRPPRSHREHIITGALLARACLFLGPLQGLAAMAAFYAHYWINGHHGQWLDLPAQGDLYQAATATTLASIACTQIGNLFAQRTQRDSLFKVGLFSNPLVWAGITAQVGLLSLIIYWPPLQAVFGTQALDPGTLPVLLAGLPLLWAVDELRKVWVRRARSRRAARTASITPEA